MNGKIICSRCGESKLADSDNFIPSIILRKSGLCRPCKSSAKIEYYHRHNKKYRDNIESRRKKAKLWRDKNPDKNKNQDLKSLYGITLEDYKDILYTQNGVCGCCGDKPKRKYFFVDHCHITKKIRGLLCNKCNLGIGTLGDNLPGLENALSYLRGNNGDN